jgi:nucleoside-diphosphate-sugar epimerase
MKKFLVVGATGGSGKEFVKTLLEQSYEVKAIVRSKSSAKALQADVIEAIECELGDGKAKSNDNVRDAVLWCDVVVSFLGTNGNTKSVQKSDYTSVIELIQLCEEIKSESLENFKFIFVSAMYITRPYSLFAIALNLYKPYVYGWKALAENKLRLSKLKYMIIRPGILTNKNLPHNVALTQGDNLTGGFISRKNLALSITACLKDRNVDSLDKVTFEIVEDKSHSGSFELKYSTLVLDSDKSFIIGDHFRATRNIKILLFSGLFLIISYLIWKYK